MSSVQILPPHIFRLGLLEIPFVRSEKHGIVGEGKGFDFAQSEYTAMAEAIERIVASEPDFARVLPGQSTTQMNRKGLVIPSLEAGTRDLYSDELCIDWAPGYLYPDRHAWIPAELVWHLYSPLSGFRALDMRQTIGLASGSTITEAFTNGLLETIERDSYAIVMRCRIECPAVQQEEIDTCGQEISQLLKELDSKGIDVHIKWISLDWPIPVAHVLFLDRMDRIPAHSHGCSAGLSPSGAITRAVLEAVQMHEGLARAASESWERMAARIESSHSHPYYAWGDPLFRPHLAHLMNSNSCTMVPPSHMHNMNCIEELCEWMMDRDHRIFWAQLGTLGGLQVVRVFVEGLVMPDARLEYLGNRLSIWVDKQKIPGPYTDPILT
ncbi:MAG: YcaO-like family protein [Methylococcales bacterium]